MPDLKKYPKNLYISKNGKDIFKKRLNSVNQLHFLYLNPQVIEQPQFSNRRYANKYAFLPKGIFPSSHFPTVQFLKQQLPKSVLAAAPGPEPILTPALGPPLQPAVPQ